MSQYARVLDDAITSTEQPPDLLEPDDPTAESRWWDLRQHDYGLAQWEAEIIAPHGWLPIVTTARPPDTDDRHPRLFGGPHRLASPRRCGRRDRGHPRNWPVKSRWRTRSRWWPSPTKRSTSSSLSLRT